MTHGLYQVVGQREYRGHKPGRKFIAQLDPAAEVRAVRRGDIVLLERVTPRIEPDTYTFPDGWLPPAAQSRNRGAARRLSH